MEWGVRTRGALSTTLVPTGRLLPVIHTAKETTLLPPAFHIRNLLTQICDELLYLVFEVLPIRKDWELRREFGA